VCDDSLLSDASSKLHFLAQQKNLEWTGSTIQTN